MNLTRVDTLLAKLELHKHELHTIEFRDEISDFSVNELEVLSANLDRAVQYRLLAVPGRVRGDIRAGNQLRIDCYTTTFH